MLSLDFIDVLNQVNVLFLTQFFKVCIYLMIDLITSSFLLSVLRVIFDMMTSKFLSFIEEARLTIKVAMFYDVPSRVTLFFPTLMIMSFGSETQLHVIFHAICCCAGKMLDKNLTVTLNFFRHFTAIQMFKRMVDKKRIHC